MGEKGGIFWDKNCYQTEIAIERYLRNVRKPFFGIRPNGHFRKKRCWLHSISLKCRVSIFTNEQMFANGSDYRRKMLVFELLPAIDEKMILVIYF